MKNRTINCFIKMFSDFVAIVVVFTKMSNFITDFLKNCGIIEQKEIILIIVAISVFISSITMLIIELLLFHVLFKPIIIEVCFLNKDNEIIKEDRFKKGSVDENFQKQYNLDISIYGGNYFTNFITNLVGGDLVIRYSPTGSYTTEILDGWINSTAGNLYKDKNNNIRYFWSDSVNKANKLNMDNPIKLRPGLIIKPNRLDVFNCHVDIQVCSSQKKNYICRFSFFVLSKFLTKCTAQSFQLILE